MKCIKFRYFHVCFRRPRLHPRLSKALKYRPPPTCEHASRVMSFLISPVLTTPLLKVPLLVSAAVCGHQGMKPPTPPPRPKEETKYNRSDYLSNNQLIMLGMAHVLRVRYSRFIPSFVSSDLPRSSASAGSPLRKSRL